MEENTGKLAFSDVFSQRKREIFIMFLNRIIYSKLNIASSVDNRKLKTQENVTVTDDFQAENSGEISGFQR